MASASGRGQEHKGRRTEEEEEEEEEEPSPPPPKKERECFAYGRGDGGEGTNMCCCWYGLDGPPFKPSAAVGRLLPGPAPFFGRRWWSLYAPPYSGPRDGGYKTRPRPLAAPSVLKVSTRYTQEHLLPPTLSSSEYSFIQSINYIFPTAKKSPLPQKMAFR